MNNLFTLASNEVTAGSVFYLNSIFGTVGGVLGGTGPELLGTLFKVFNTTVLALGSLIVTYTTVASILMTAHEGEALGKKFHTMWIPIRTVMGIAALIPTATGYSYLQIGLMWIIIQGVGAADTLWSTTVDYVASGQSTIPNPPGGVNPLLQSQLGQLFQGLVCQAAVRAKYGSGYFCSDNSSNPFCTANDTLSIVPGSSQVKNGVYQMGPGGVCGSLTLGDSTEVGQAKNQAFSQIVSTFGTLANQFVGIDYAYTVFLNTPAGTPPSPPSWVTDYCNANNLSGALCDPQTFSSDFPVPSPTNANESKRTVTDLYWQYGLSTIAGGNFLSTAASLYTGLVGAAMTTSNSSNNLLKEVQEQAKSTGWIFAGSYFYYLAKANNKIETNVGSIPVNMPDIASLPKQPEKALTPATQTLVDFIAESSAPGQDLGVGTACNSKKFAAFNPACRAIVEYWLRNLSGSSRANITQNPVITAQGFGDRLLSVVTWSVITLFTINLLGGIAGGVWLGVGPLVAAAVTFSQTLVPIAMFFLFIILGLGLTLAVYTPMIPYILFTFGAINWLIATIETMIAAPLVAIGLLHPEGHEMWGQAEKALMLILNIFLRPTLMVFGMIAGMLMSFTVVMMINYAFLNVVHMVSPNSGVLEIIFFMVLYTILFTTAMNKCFDLIHLIPDKTMRWIGGGAEQFGEAGGLEKISGAMEKGGTKAESGIGGGVTGAGRTGKISEGIGKRKKGQAGRGAGGGVGGPPGGGGGGGPPAVPPPA